MFAGRFFHDASRQRQSHRRSIISHLTKGVFSTVTSSVNVNRLVGITRPTTSRTLRGGGVSLHFRLLIVPRVHFNRLFTFINHGVSEHAMSGLHGLMLLRQVVMNVSIVVWPCVGQP